jgi:hypothetical protein
VVRLRAKAGASSTSRVDAHDSLQDLFASSSSNASEAPQVVVRQEQNTTFVSVGLALEDPFASAAEMNVNFADLLRRAEVSLELDAPLSALLEPSSGESSPPLASLLVGRIAANLEFRRALPVVLASVHPLFVAAVGFTDSSIRVRFGDVGPLAEAMSIKDSDSEILDEVAATQEQNLRMLAECGADEQLIAQVRAAQLAELEEARAYVDSAVLWDKLLQPDAANEVRDMLRTALGLVLSSDAAVHSLARNLRAAYDEIEQIAFFSRSGAALTIDLKEFGVLRYLPME